MTMSNPGWFCACGAWVPMNSSHTCPTPHFPAVPTRQLTPEPSSEGAAAERALILAWLRNPRANGLHTNHARKCAEYFADCIQRGAHRRMP